mgnify:CR=1 FL=1
MARHVCVIPARMGSSRFPGKPLIPLLGLPLVIHVAQRCRLYRGFERVILATCDQEIIDAARTHGFEAVMTSDRHERCTDRVEEAVATLKLDLGDDDVVAMVQGDEVLVTPRMIADVVETQVARREPVVNLASRLYRPEDMADINTVKVVAAPDGRALYFSRAAIPSRGRAPDAACYQQTGVMAFAPSFLARFAQLPPTPLEIIESCDMLRLLEHGLTVRIILTETETIGIDTPADRDRGENMLRADPTTSLYLKA